MSDPTIVAPTDRVMTTAARVQQMLDLAAQVADATRDPGCHKCGGDGQVETAASLALPAGYHPDREWVPCTCVDFLAGWHAEVDAIADRIGGAS